MKHEFVEPWHPVSETGGPGLIAELYKEVPEGHLLFGTQVEVIARRLDVDDILVKIKEENRWAYVHLTWSRKPEKTADYPFTVVFDTWEAVCDQLLLVDNQDLKANF